MNPETKEEEKKQETSEDFKLTGKQKKRKSLYPAGTRPMECVKPYGNVD